MRWRDRRRSDNVEFRKGGGAAGAAGFSGLAFFILRFVFGRFGIGGVVVLVGGFFALKTIGLDPLQMLNGGGLRSASNGESIDLNSEEAQRVMAVVGTTEDVWTQIFRDNNARYPAPQVVVFQGSTTSGCGAASASTGPFYCPADQKVYFDLAFFDELSRRFGAPGDFAEAYVIAHEVGHHVQTVLGTSKQVRAAQQRASQTEQNALQVRMELQADCYAGLWAHHANSAKDFLEEGDVEEALKAASAIGDDTLQRNAGRRVNHESFTHGSSAQRVKWFRTGLQSGQLQTCDTFQAQSL